MNSNLTLTAVLLAGGESRRMGTDKTTLAVGGESLWSRQLRTLRELAPESILVSARTRPGWCPADIETVLDRAPSRGPLSGLAAALKKIQTTHLLALAVDLPRMSSSHLRELWSRARPHCGVLPGHGEFIEPLGAIYPVEAAVLAAARLESGDGSLQSLAQELLTRNELAVYALNREEQRFYHNLNMPSDLAVPSGRPVF